MLLSILLFITFLLAGTSKILDKQNLLCNIQNALLVTVIYSQWLPCSERLYNIYLGNFGFASFWPVYFFAVALVICHSLVL